jgi:phosphoenolpyruvate synthase/pyruvate phosphate dikinase
MGQSILLAEAQSEDMIGGKAASLGEMLRAGFRVPDGFVVTGSKSELSTLKQVILETFEKLDATRVAVRSSAIHEDGLDASWAGQLDTFLNVSKGSLLEHLAVCMDSARSNRAQAYARHLGTPAGRVAVIVQAMVPSDVSGVCFSIHPITQDTNQMVIEAAYGLGEAVVSGEVTPDNYVVSRRGRHIISRSVTIQPKALRFSKQNNDTIWIDTADPSAQKLNDEYILKLADTVKKIESHFGHPVDVEWSLYKDKLYILQSRPITTLA